MAGWNHDKTQWKKKSCVVCETLFTPKSGPHKFCSEECKGRWQYISGKVTTESQYESISGNWSRYCSRLMYYGGRKRDKLTVEVILDKLSEQNYKCALSGLPLTCILKKGVKTPTNASIDRIEAGGPYSEDNIQIVCRALNHWRADTSIEDFVKFCKAVAENFDQ
jgi:hypothetical protein